jgi:hypothetical protein
MKDAYRRLYNTDVERDVSGDTSGDYKHLLLEILKVSECHFDSSRMTKHHYHTILIMFLISLVPTC